MMRPLLTGIFVSFIISVYGQTLSSSSIFAHNDYAKAKPFYNAYSLQVGFIEADIFLKRGRLLVAHTSFDLNNSRTLDSLYLKPLQSAVIRNLGSAYAGGGKLTLMVDLKTKGDVTLSALVQRLRLYPELISCKNLFITVSGNVPDPATWTSYPEFIHFDGRPKIVYNEQQLKRVELISDNFKNYSHWNGKGAIPKDDLEQLKTVVSNSHALGKPIRFWAIPDDAEGWSALLELGVDVLNTDHVEDAAAFVAARKR